LPGASLAEVAAGEEASEGKKQVQTLASCHFIEHGDNVLVLGPPGVGKTHLAAALGLKAIAAGYRVLFTTPQDPEHTVDKLGRPSVELNEKKSLPILSHVRCYCAIAPTMLMASRQVSEKRDDFSGPRKYLLMNFVTRRLS
jgi:hypothetical protein